MLHNAHIRPETIDLPASVPQGRVIDMGYADVRPAPPTSNSTRGNNVHVIVHSPPHYQRRNGCRCRTACLLKLMFFWTSMIIDLQRLDEHQYIEIHTDLKADKNMLQTRIETV